MYYVFLFLLFAEVENKFDWEDLCCMLLGLIEALKALSAAMSEGEVCAWTRMQWKWMRVREMMVR